MKKPKKDGGHKGITPGKAKRRPGTWNPSPVKKRAGDCSMSYRPQGK